LRIFFKLKKIYHNIFLNKKWNRSNPFIPMKSKHMQAIMVVYVKIRMTYLTFLIYKTQKIPKWYLIMIFSIEKMSMLMIFVLKHQCVLFKHAWNKLFQMIIAKLFMINLKSKQIIMNLFIYIPTYKLIQRLI